MSVSILRLIPDDPFYVPDEHLRTAGLACVTAQFPKAAEIKEVLTANIEFIDQGGNFEYIRCPVCDRLIDDSWWEQVMGEIYDPDLGFSQLGVQTPCCGQRISLNELEYHWPAGFARYRIEVRDPNSEFTDEKQATLERTLHTSVRKVWARY